MKQNEPLTIFISSTFSDLVEYREAAHAAIRRLRNHANDMIYWSADEHSPDIISIENVKRSDLMIIILAHRCGTIIPGDSKSFTEIEYDTAKDQGIPVFAFFVEPTYPWNPANIDIDPQLREKLGDFKSRIEKSHVWQFFTTPDSLTIQITQALANFDKRRSPSAILSTQEPTENILLVKSRLELLQKSDLPALVGESEDGLSLILQINRAQDIREPLEKISNYLERTRVQAPIDGIERVLKEEGERVWVEKGVWDIRMPSGQISRCYVSFRSLSALFSPSLLTTLLSLPRGYLDAIFSTNVPPWKMATQTQTTSIESRYGRDARVESTGGENRFLALSISDDEQNFAAGWDEKSKRYVAQPKYWRELVFESLFGFSECFFKIFEQRHSQPERLVAEADLRSYKDALQHLLETNRYNIGMRYRSRFRVSRRAIAEVILRIAQKLVSLHKSGLVHGDIKPQNILVARNGPILIDLLSLKKGEIAPAISPGWAAPEQIILRPVSEATDIYPLGLMLTSLLSGRLTGEITKYVISDPSTGGTRTISFFQNPVVYLDLNNSLIPFQSRIAWLDFIERCLRYDSTERPTNAQEFITSLRKLLADYPIEGTIEFGVRDNRDEHPQLARLPSGQEIPCRVLKDDWHEYYSRLIWRGSHLSDQRIGSQSSLKCASCGVPVEDGAAFCDNCGASIITTSFNIADV